MKILRFLVPLLLLCFVEGAFAQQTTVSEFEILFIDRSSIIDPKVGENARQIALLKQLFERVKENPDMEITDIEISGYTSLENTHENNTRLSRDRAIALTTLINSQINLPPGIVHYNSDYIPWRWLKLQLVMSNLPDKDKAIAIIDSPQEMMEYFPGATRDRRIFNLRWIDHIDFWTYLEENYFPCMRKATAKITVLKKGTTTPRYINF